MGISKGWAEVGQEAGGNCRHAHLGEKERADTVLARGLLDPEPGRETPSVVGDVLEVAKEEVDRVRRHLEAGLAGVSLENELEFERVVLLGRAHALDDLVAGGHDREALGRADAVAAESEKGLSVSR
jgi:hypothetical protein